MPFDLSSIDIKGDSEAGGFLHLKDPRSGELIYSDGEPVGLYVKGPFSQAYLDANEIVEKRAEAIRAERTTYKADGSIDKRGTLTTEENKRDNLDMFCAIVTGWKNLAWKGQTEFSTEALREMISEREWIDPQINLFIRNLTNFIPGRVNS